jgi:hypothetical protein
MLQLSTDFFRCCFACLEERACPNLGHLLQTLWLYHTPARK